MPPMGTHMQPLLSAIRSHLLPALTKHEASDADMDMWLGFQLDMEVCRWTTPSSIPTANTRHRLSAPLTLQPRSPRAVGT